jgi:ribosome biogenesis ATPase
VSDFKVALPNVQPSAKREGFATVPDVTWEDVGALDHIRDELSLSILVSLNVMFHLSIDYLLSLLKGTCSAC